MNSDITMYLNSTVEVATTECFFDYHAIGSLSINIINSEMDFLFVGSPTK